MSTPIYGYDRHMKAIKHGSIVRFIDGKNGHQRVGHVWEGEDWESDDRTKRRWNVSFNHTYSESGQPIEWGRNYRVIGNVEINEDDEDLMDLDVTKSSLCQAPGWGRYVTWTPYPHWTP